MCQVKKFHRRGRRERRDLFKSVSVRVGLCGSVAYVKIRWQMTERLSRKHERENKKNNSQRSEVGGRGALRLRSVSPRWNTVKHSTG